MKPPKAEDIMQQPVFSVNANATVEDALRTMEEKSVKKILVKDGEIPLGVLEEWMVTESDYQRQVRLMDLRRFERARTDDLITDIEKKILEYSTVYIHDPDNPDDFVGVITRYDLVRAF